MSAPDLSVETPSGKGAGDENFPVGSFLLPAPLRPHVARFYAFARAIDDIADNPDLDADEKVRRLDAMERGVTGAAGAGEPGLETAASIRESLHATHVPARHCQDLVSAFRQDAVKNRYESWPELMDYCIRSAAPVGRYLLDLHGESKSAWPYSDALCNALQVINHLQDCADDYAALDRVYLPGEWLRAADTDVSSLSHAKSSPGLRRVMDLCLDGTEALLDEAVRLPGALRSRRLALESALIIRVAQRLTRELRRRDPVAERIELTKPQYLACAVSGIWWVLTGASAG